MVQAHGSGAVRSCTSSERTLCFCAPATTTALVCRMVQVRRGFDRFLSGDLEGAVVTFAEASELGWVA